jgi:hypothetical protein
MDFGRAFLYTFEDRDWLRKLLIAALLMIIPFLGTMFVAGWALKITRQVIQGDPEPLADWDDFGGYLVKGFQVFVIGLVYALPIILISACTSGLSVTFLENSSGDEFSSAFSVVMLCVSCLSIFYGIFLAFMIPAALGNFAASDQFGAAFRFGEVFGLVRKAPMAYFMVFLGSLLAGIIAMVGIILCFIGVLFTSAYAQTIIANLQGQAYIEATGGVSSQAVETV